VEASWLTQSQRQVGSPLHIGTGRPAIDDDQYTSAEDDCDQKVYFYFLPRHKTIVVHRSLANLGRHDGTELTAKFRLPSVTGKVDGAATVVATISKLFTG
jgi:hypothetical protein